MWLLLILFAWLVALTIALGIVAFVGWQKFHLVAEILELQTVAMERMRASIPVTFPRYADAVIALPATPTTCRHGYGVDPIDLCPWVGCGDAETKSCLPDPENAPFFTQSAPVK